MWMDLTLDPFTEGYPEWQANQQIPSPWSQWLVQQWAQKPNQASGDQWRLTRELYAKHTSYYLLNLNLGVGSPTSCCQWSCKKSSWKRANAKEEGLRKKEARSSLITHLSCWIKPWRLEGTVCNFVSSVFPLYTKPLEVKIFYYLLL